MTKFSDYKEIISNLIKLSLPILGGNISQVLVNLADTIIAGRYSTLALGAVSVASAIIMTAIIGAIGLIMSISPVISNFRGANIRSKKYFKLTLLFSIIVSIPFFILIEFLILKLPSLGLSPELFEPVKVYLEICSWTVFPSALFIALKEFLQAYEKVVFANFLMLFMVILNVILNIVLAFGFDFNGIQIPEMGVRGLALATLISKTLVALLMILYCLPLFKTPFEKSKKYVKDLFKTGFPISLAMFFEFLGFNLTAVLIGKFSALFAGVHNIILCIANCTFMIALSISSAASIRVGYFNGKKDKFNIKRYAFASILMIIGVCVVTFCLLEIFKEQIIFLFSKDPEVLYWCKKILKIALCFLFFDGLQCACVGVLKGLKDTKIIMFTMLFAYLIIAIPFGSYFAFYHGYVLEGYWTGLALALFFAAIVTSLRLIYDVRKMK